MEDCPAREQILAGPANVGQASSCYRVIENRNPGRNGSSEMPAPESCKMKRTKRHFGTPPNNSGNNGYLSMTNLDKNPLAALAKRGA